MANYLDIQIFSDLVRSKRGLRGLREIANEIGSVSPSTISRVENGKMPDIDTFLALCDWLEIEPGEFIKSAKHKKKSDDYSAICSKLRTDKRIDSNIGNAIASLIEAVFDNS